MPILSLIRSTLRLLTERESEEYIPTLPSPVLTTMSLMSLFVTAIANDRFLFLADATSAFLLAPWLSDEIVFARTPKGYDNHPEFKGKILRLAKILYGLKQAPRSCNGGYCAKQDNDGDKEGRGDDEADLADLEVLHY